MAVVGISSSKPIQSPSLICMHIYITFIPHPSRTPTQAAALAQQVEGLQGAKRACEGALRTARGER